jgi:hypothetical protein
LIICGNLLLVRLLARTQLLEIIGAILLTLTQEGKTKRTVKRELVNFMRTMHALSRTVFCAWMLWVFVDGREVDGKPYTDWIFMRHSYETLKECETKQKHWTAPDARHFFGKESVISDVQCYPSDFDPRGKDQWTRLKR